MARIVALGLASCGIVIAKLQTDTFLIPTQGLGFIYQGCRTELQAYITAPEGLCESYSVLPFRGCAQQEEQEQIRAVPGSLLPSSSSSSSIRNVPPAIITEALPKL